MLVAVPLLQFSSLGDGLLLSKISDRYQQLNQAQRLGDVFLQACRDGTLRRSTFASVSRLGRSSEPASLLKGLGIALS